MRAGSSSWPDGPEAVRSAVRSSGVAIGLRIEAGALTLAGDELLDSDLVGVAQRAGREPARLEHDAPTSPNRSNRRPARVVFRICEQHNRPPHRPRHPARGVPPPARAPGARRSCSSRSSRAGSAATPSSGAATGCVTFAEAEALAEPVVGYLGYDHVAKLEPTVPLPADGPEPAREPVRRRRHARPLRPRARSPRCSRRPRARWQRCSRGGPAVPPEQAGGGGKTRVRRAGRTTSAASSAARSTFATATRSRSCSRSAPSAEPAPRRSRSTGRCAASTRRRTSSCWSSTGSRSSARRPRRSSRPRARARA